MKNVLLLLPLLMACGPISAKCASERFVFFGTVLNDAGAPLSGALVGISWLEQAGVTGPALSQTDMRGRYTIPVVFDTYSDKGAVAEDQCNQKIATISVVAQKGQLRSSYQRVSVDSPGRIRIPTLKVLLKIDEKPAVRLIQPSQRTRKSS